MTIGQFQWLFSGPAVVLAVGGVLAFVVSLFAGRQIGGHAASRALKRALRRRGGELLDNPVEHTGVLIAVEGADPELVAAYREAIVEHVRAQGYRAIAQRRDDGWPVPPSFSASLLDPGSASAVEQTPATTLRALAALSDRVAGGVRPDLDLGSVVVCSDYVDATVVRFGACGGLDEEQVLLTAIWAVDGLLPDLTVLVDRLPGQAATRNPEIPAPPALSEPDLADRAARDERAAYRDRAATAPERYVVARGPAPVRFRARPGTRRTGRFGSAPPGA